MESKYCQQMGAREREKKSVDLHYPKLTQALGAKEKHVDVTSGSHINRCMCRYPLCVFVVNQLTENVKVSR